jgi:hypothetical protein
VKVQVSSPYSPCICNMLNDHCHRVSTQLQSINIIIIIIIIIEQATKAQRESTGIALLFP